MWKLHCQLLLVVKILKITISFYVVKFHIEQIVQLCCAVPPLFVIEFLHRIVTTFEDYFTECTESTLKDNYVIVYEVVLQCT